jgi:hypothetical protein
LELPLTVSFLLSTLLAMGVPPCLDYCFKFFEFFCTFGGFSSTKIYHSLYQKYLQKTSEVVHLYTSEYCKLWEKAAVLNDGPEKQFYLKKKAATRTLMKANDPVIHLW